MATKPEQPQSAEVDQAAKEMATEHGPKLGIVETIIASIIARLIWECIMCWWNNRTVEEGVQAMATESDGDEPRPRVLERLMRRTRKAFARANEPLSEEGCEDIARDLWRRGRRAPKAALCSAITQ
jgi:hypothetical protein